MIERLRELYKHSCMNCRKLEMYHDGCVSKILYIDYDCEDNDGFKLKNNRHFYLTPEKENDCELFEQDEIGRNQKFLREWKEGCYGKKNL